MASKSIPPLISETAFDCPHCGAYTTQYWFTIHCQANDKNEIPDIPNIEKRKRITNSKEIQEELKRTYLHWCDKMDTGLVFIESNNEGKRVYKDINNLFLSQCYNCNKVAVWVHDNLIFPSKKIGINPNPDLPEDIIHDFEEARSIIGESPRGAAALLRLCVQKLCIYLGEKGENINTDIASLVSKGLNPLAQKSLDIVRVIGGEAVHPGVIDLKDDRDTAIHLLTLINSIADQMISHPKKIEELYGKLPQSKREAIEKRDNKPKS
jgi:hypothetical protein